MAKKTKDSNLSIEERLEQALIPNWDEPYKLPENWCWVKLSVACSLENGEKSTEKGLVYLDAKTLRGTTEPQTRDSGIVVNKDQKVILVDGENSGEVFVVPYRGYMGSTFKIINIAANADEMYIRYFIDHNRERLRNSKVGSAIPHLNKDLFFDLKLPFPPLNEQKRIVSHIESFFAKLDEAKEKAQEVVDCFETRKAAILCKAFSGELTAKWREEHDVASNTWTTKSLEDVCKSIYDGDHMPPPKSENGIPFLVISNVNTGYLSFEDTRFVPKEYYDNITDTRKPQKGDVLYTLVGSYGIPVVVDTDKAFCFQRHMALLKPLSIDTYFLWYLLQTQEIYQKASAIAKGVAQITVPIKGLRAMQFSCPSIEEQQEVVRLLDTLIKKELRVKEAAEVVIEQIDIMKKAILARAFRGELGTNDPTEASAIELIKQIIEEKIKIEESKPKRTLLKRKEVSFVAKTILEALKSSEKLTPEKLKAETALEIDDFYDQLKVLIDDGQIREIRIDGESYLEAAK